MDGQTWLALDRQANNRDFLNWNTVVFTVMEPVECPFVRIVQTAKKHNNFDYMTLRAVEFFGTLSE
jgi:hypothetical protein